MWELEHVRISYVQRRFGRFFVAVEDVLPTKDLCPSLINDSCIDTTASHPCSRHEPTHMSEKGAHGIIGDLTQQAQHPRSTHPRSSVQVPLLKITWLTRPLRLTSRRGLKLLESYGTKGGNCSRCNWKETNFKLGKSDHERYNFIPVANQPVLESWTYLAFKLTKCGVIYGLPC
jgi:hypothetical protein